MIRIDDLRVITRGHGGGGHGARERGGQGRNTLDELPCHTLALFARPCLALPLTAMCAKVQLLKVR